LPNQPVKGANQEQAERRRHQAFAGLRYRLNEGMGLSVEYRYLKTEAPEWDLEIGGSAHATLAFGRIETHAFSLAFDYRF